MNKVKSINKDDVIVEYQEGDIFTIRYGAYYILAIVDYSRYENEGRYTAVNLDDGNRWKLPTPIIEDAVEGLTLYKRNAEITIK